MRMKHLTADFKIKKMSAREGLIIEGLANAATVDRMKEMISPDAWDLENYSKNPVVLFNHGKDPTFGVMPIGKALEVEPRNEGLYTKIQISSSKSEKITAVRDLVEEGILKTFSVGFDPKDSQKSADQPDVTIVTRAELVETSVVPIPMNQDSTFSMLKHKRAHLFVSPTARRWFEKFTERARLVKKGAWVAAALHQRFNDLIEIGEIRNKDAALRYIAEEGETTVAAVRAALGGDGAVPEKMLAAFASVLKTDHSLLSTLNSGDASVLDRLLARDEDEDQPAQGGDPMATKAKAPAGKKDGMAPPKKPEDAPPPADAPKDDDAPPKPDDEKGDAAPAVIYSICISKEAVADPEAAKQQVADAGYKADKMTETETEWEFVQQEMPADAAQVLLLDLGNGVYAKVGPKGGAAPKEEPPADAEPPKPDEGKAAEPPPPGAEPPKKPDAPPKPEAAPPPAADDARGILKEWLVAAIQMVKDGAKPEDTIAMLNKIASAIAGTASKDLPPMAGKGTDAGPVDDNPYLELSRQNNLLMAQLINEVQGMSSKLDGLADMTLAKVADEGAEEPPADGGTASEDEGKDEDVRKSLDLLKTYQRDLDMKLKRLGA